MCAASPRRGLTASGNVESMVEMVSLSPSRILKILINYVLYSYMCLKHGGDGLALTKYDLEDLDVHAIMNYVLCVHVFEKAGCIYCISLV